MEKYMVMQDNIIPCKPKVFQGFLEPKLVSKKKILACSLKF